MRAPLFIDQYSDAWLDVRSQQDAYANYFNNSVAATQAHKLFCVSLRGQFSDYSNAVWGITASDSANNGYVAWGGPPSMGSIDGTPLPRAAAGSLPFLSNEAHAVLRPIHNPLTSNLHRHCFLDACNP